MAVRPMMPGWAFFILSSMATSTCVEGFASSPLLLGTILRRQQSWIRTPLGLGVNDWKRKVGPNLGAVFKAAPPTTARPPTTAHPPTTMFVGRMMNAAPLSHFDRTADKEMTLMEGECLLEIDGLRYNVTAWAKAHPGGVNVLRKFHNKDASKVFHAAGHSVAAYAMLQDFRISSDHNVTASISSHSTISHPTATMATSSFSWKSKRPRWQQKLFTKEDPIGVHKYLGIFCLLNFVYRFGQMYVGDSAAGFGSSTKSFWPVLSLLPHALLSLSSLIFHTVPRERVVGKPMIWKEYRIHNIAFGLRSILCGFLAWLPLRYSQKYPLVRPLAVVGSGCTVLATMIVADLATHHLQPSKIESTTATMPYWEGCSMATQKRFKTFYAYSQFLATLACLAVCNPAWPLAVLWPIQSASFLLTLVRKGILSAKGVHIAYTITLAMPYIVGLRNGFIIGHWFLPALLSFAALLFSIRRLGISKYVIWIPVVVARILVGDRLVAFQVW